MRDLAELPTIHFTKMADQAADSPIYEEVKTFRRELPRLLAEGHEGKWVLIKGDKIVGLFESLDEGYCRGRKLYLLQPFIVQPVSEQQPLLRGKVPC